MRLSRYVPLLSAVTVVTSLLMVAGTTPADIIKYVAYAILAVILPGTLVYRSLRRGPHTLVEDLAFGAAVGLTLELAAWAVFSALEWLAVVRFWPLLVFIPFAAIPSLRRHWWVREYPQRVPRGWAWALAGVIAFFAAYLYGVFYSQNPIIPDSEDTVQFLDLAYQLSLAGEAKQGLPFNLPQVAGEPLRYHWFAFVHLGMSSMVGGIDLPVITMRLMVLAICALAAVLIAVVTWRLAERRWAGIVAAVLFFVIGDFDFAAVPWPPFGTQVTFVVWPSLSMTSSWALLIALIGVAGEILRGTADKRTVPAIGPAAYLLVALFAVASSATKASSLPVAFAAIALVILIGFVTTRRIPWKAVYLALIIGAAQLFALAVVFAFQRYGLKITPLAAIEWAWASGGRTWWKQAVVLGAVWLAFLLHLQLKAVGIIPLAWHQRFRLHPVQWFLLGGAVAGPALHLMLSGYAATWFTRTGFPFAVILSAWGYALVFERAGLGRRGKLLLGSGSAIFAIALCLIEWTWAVETYPRGKSYSVLIPMLLFAGALVAIVLLGSVLWLIARRRLSYLRGRGGLVILTVAMLAGAPGLLMDVKMSWGVAGGPYELKVPVPAARAEAARWVRAHSDPDDILATNSHCALPVRTCELPRSFWLSAYSERQVLVEGWWFAPRAQVDPYQPFWDQRLLQLNEDCIYRTTAPCVAELRNRYHVRYIVVARDVAPESPDLAALAELRFDNGTVAVYELP